MNLLIVDDNVPFANGLKQGTDWSRFPAIDCVFTAYSMKQAIGILKNTSVELLITDIKMRGGSGLDLIAWMQKQNLRFASIILSSYPDFQYAQKALQLGVVDYLLKPAENQDLERALFNAIHALASRSPSLKPDHTSGTVNPVIEQIRSYIEEHLSEKITRSQLADLAGFNPEYLSTLFRRETGLTLSEYIRAQRFTSAKKLLGQTNLSVSMVSQHCGFESTAYFSSLFRQNTGMTPLQYRKNLEKTSAARPSQG